MTSPSFRDLEHLSAYLDGQLSRAEKQRMETRLQSDHALAVALDDLRQTRALLRRAPHRRAPRNFTLTPKMAGIRPPVPRLVPVFSWASAVAMLLFIFTLGTGLFSNLSFGAAAPKAYGMGGGPAAMAAPATVAPATMAPATVAPATLAPAPLAPAATPEPTCGPEANCTQTPAADQTLLPTPTAEVYTMSINDTPEPGTLRNVPPEASSKVTPTLNPWLLIWPGLAILLGAAALLTWGLNKRAFERKNPRTRK